MSSKDERRDTLGDDDDVLVDVDDDSMTGEGDSSVANLSIAKKETKAVAFFRVILFVALIVLAVGVSLVAFFASRKGEIEDFENTFEGHALKVVTSFEHEASEKRDALISMAVALASHAEFANETWPFVSLPDFERKTMLTRSLADVIAIMVLPVVRKHQLKEWAEYSSSNMGWFWEGIKVQEMFDRGNTSGSFGDTGVDHFDSAPLNTSGTIIKFQEAGPNDNMIELEESDEGPYFPVWQYSPQIQVPVVNADFRTLPDAANELNAFLDDNRRRNIIGPGFEFQEGSGGAVFIDLLLERWRAGGRHYDGGPLSYYYFPIFESAVRDSPLVGVLQAFVYWNQYFEDLLPETAKGIIAVLDNTCEQSFTFSIYGRRASFLGNGDLHDSKYDDMEVSTEYGVFLKRSPLVDMGGCFYRVRVYPSQEMEGDHLTFGPLIFCLSILAVFVFTVAVFIAYDRFVERRQKLVMRTAVQSSGVVSKLFPENVRERLYEKEQNKEKESKGQFSVGNRMMLKQFAGNVRDSSTSSSDRLRGAGKPIADEYLHCTVFFADLAGFTKWSSTRTPTDVFFLLETLYGAFDKIAKRLGVFKIETIGDCYVAVTGLPIPQDNHAVIMTKFAASLIMKMNQVINSEDILMELGGDTAALEMRVGMHSGPVTAGVLRGEKARFQLFGDTVNTAARMESNGQKGRIQVSQDTADLLIAAGNDHWLTAREDLVEAKGKGKMQCYWVNFVAEKSLRSRTMSTSVASSEEGSKLVASSSLLLPTLDDGTISSDSYRETEEFENIMEV